MYLPLVQGSAAVTLADEARPKEERFIVSTTPIPLSLPPRYCVWERGAVRSRMRSEGRGRIAVIAIIGNTTTTTHQATVVTFKRQGAACGKFEGKGCTTAVGRCRGWDVGQDRASGRAPTLAVIYKGEVAR